MFRRWRERRFEAELAKVAAAREAHRIRIRRPIQELDPLTRELVEIGSAGGFLAPDGDEERTREIGMKLYTDGGMAAMQAAHEQVAAWLPYQARGLEFVWNGIGDWLG